MSAAVPFDTESGDVPTSGPWAEMTATQRGALMRRLGDLIARDAAKLAATEVRDNGKLLAEMQGQLNYIRQWFHYYGGLADKIQGSTLPARGKPKCFVGNAGLRIVAARARSMSRMLEFWSASSAATDAWATPICAASSRMFWAPAPDAAW